MKSLYRLAAERVVKSHTSFRMKHIPPMFVDYIIKVGIELGEIRITKGNSKGLNYTNNSIVSHFEYKFGYICDTTYTDGTRCKEMARKNYFGCKKHKCSYEDCEKDYKYSHVYDHYVFGDNSTKYTCAAHTCMNRDGVRHKHSRYCLSCIKNKICIVTGCNNPKTGKVGGCGKHTCGCGRSIVYDGMICDICYG